MELLNLEQGTSEWLEARKSHFTASDAPAVMGASKYKTRKQLLDEKSGAETEVITPAKQKLFNKGHKAEDEARNVLALETLDEYLPCVGIQTEIQGLPLMASFDGRSDDEDHLFEHKLWNQTLAENVRNGALEPSHYWQLEHQLLVDEKAEYVLFVVSDGTGQNREMMKYYSQPERREELIKAWAIFQKDLESHQVEAKQETVVADKQNLPAIICSVKGSQITTNISSCLVEVQKLAKAEMSRAFETDQDFADKDQLNKDVKKARAELKERVASVKAEFVSYSEFEEVALKMDEVLQKMQSHGEKQVKQAKDTKKMNLQNEALAKITAHVNECDEIIKAPFSIEQVVSVSPEFAQAMKNKRTIASIEDALDTEVNKWKVLLTTATEVIAPNFKFLESEASEYKFLFQDVFTLINQPEESFKAIVTTRINEHKKIEAERLAEEKARIEAEAKEKAEREAQAKIEAEAEAIRKQERDRIIAENKAIAEHEEAIKINAEFDEYKASQVEVPLTATDKLTKEEADILASRNSEPVKPYVANEIKPSISQLQKNIDAIEAQKTHNPLDAEFINWSREYSIRSDAFLALEKLINKHFR